LEDLKRYGSGTKQEERRKKLYPPCCAHPELICEACVVVDVEGIILMWYLPGLLSPKSQVSRPPNPSNGKPISLIGLGVETTGEGGKSISDRFWKQ